MQTRPTHSLEPHPLNQKIYGKPKATDKAFTDLRDSIKAEGILTPLLITNDDVIISGHTRWHIAKLLRIDSLECAVHPSKDPLDIERLVINANRQREKTDEQRAREYKELKRIEGEKAKKRQAVRAIKDASRLTTGQEHLLVENFPQAEEQGKSRDIAAAAVGWSGKTADKAEAVVERIDELEEQGLEEQADELRETLNNKSVSAAYKEAVPEKATPKITPPPKPQAAKDVVDRVALRRLQDLYEAMNSATQDAFIDWVTGMCERESA